MGLLTTLDLNVFSFSICERDVNVLDIEIGDPEMWTQWGLLPRKHALNAM